MNNKNATILGMGNALVDIMTKLDSDSTLQEYNLPKGSMQLVDNILSETIDHGTRHLEKTLSSGGSASNTIHGVARLGLKCGFIGCVGNDKLGLFFEEDMRNSGIKPHLFKEETASGKAIALVSPDSERTFATFLGAAIELTDLHLDAALFEGYHHFHIEGYLVQNRNLISKAVKLAKEKGMTVSLDLASYNVVEANLDFLKEVIAEGIDIVFANEEEAKAFTGMEPREAVIELGKITKVAIVKTGVKGSLVMCNDEITEVESFKAKSIDTTGAGDLYASGFLYGYLNGLSLKKAGLIGSWLAANVIEVIGAKIDDNHWDIVLERVKEIENA